MNTAHHLHPQHEPDPQQPTNHEVSPAPRRPSRCLRHRAWMASCDDCRAAHTDPAGRTRQGAGRAA